MELVAGDTLRDWLKQPREWRDVLAVLRGAGAGLAAAHAAGLVHRDFKPGNVLVSAVDGRARRMDFGLARLDFGLARLHAEAVQDPDAPRSSDADIELHSPLHQSLTITGSVDNLADLARESGDLAAATSSIERAKAIAEAALGPKHPFYHTVVTTLGEIQLAAGKRAEAKRTLDDLIVLETANQSPVLPTTLATRAEIALGESKWADALGFADRAIASLEASGGKDSADLWRPLAARGRALVALKQPKEAKLALTRAMSGDKPLEVQISGALPAGIQMSPPLLSSPIAALDEEPEFLEVLRLPPPPGERRIHARYGSAVCI